MAVAPLRGVMICAGNVAVYHIDGWDRLPDVGITAICDVDPIRADDLAHGTASRRASPTGAR